MLLPMQRVVLLVVLIFASGLTAASAQQTGAKEAIEKCLETTASEPAGFGGRCIGIVAGPCIKKAEGSASDVKDKKACAARELAVWNGILTAALRQIKAGAEAKMNASVTSAQAT